jgi:hypothetical protein
MHAAGQIREEQRRRDASEEKAAQIDHLLTELKREASALRQAAEEHARCSLTLLAAAAVLWLLKQSWQQHNRPCSQMTFMPWI